MSFLRISFCSYRMWLSLKKKGLVWRGGDSVECLGGCDSAERFKPQAPPSPDALGEATGFDPFLLAMWLPPSDGTAVKNRGALPFTPPPPPLYRVSYTVFAVALFRTFKGINKRL